VARVIAQRAKLGQERIAALASIDEVKGDE
jgi:hypothetical protein